MTLILIAEACCRRMKYRFHLGNGGLILSGQIIPRCAETGRGKGDLSMWRADTGGAKGEF
jgi:hypothetical protein